jgi:hypothetical protein
LKPSKNDEALIIDEDFESDLGTHRSNKEMEITKTRVNDEII